MILFVLAGAACEPSAPKVTPLAPEPAAKAAEAAAPAPVPESAPDASLQQLLGLKPEPEVGAEPKPETQPKPKAEPEPAVEPSRQRTRPKASRRSRQGEEAFRPDPSPIMAAALPPAKPSGLTDWQFKEAVADWDGLHACIRTQTARTERASGALRIAFTIRPSGEVEQAQVTEGSADPGLKRCVERRAKRIKFARFDGGDAVERSAKFVF